MVLQHLDAAFLQQLDHVRNRIEAPAPVVAQAARPVLRRLGVAGHGIRRRLPGH